MITRINKTVTAIFFWLLSLLLMACGKLEPYDKIYYHNVGAEGYVYYQDKPVPDVRITVWSKFKSKGWLTTKQPIDERFTTDPDGYFCIQFIKRTGHQDVVNYQITISNDTIQHNQIAIYPEEIRNSKQNIQLGILNLTRKLF